MPRNEWRDNRYRSRYRGQGHGDWETGYPRETGYWSGYHGDQRAEYSGQREYSDDYPSYGSQYGRDRDFGYRSSGRGSRSESYGAEYEPWPTGRRNFAPGYGRGDLSGDSYGSEPRSYRGGYEDQYGRYGYADDSRTWWDRANDEVYSWFGDEGARRRRELDEIRDNRGRGPKGYKRSDERIREDLSDKLSDDRWLDASDIEIQVKNREVTLSGTVDSRSAKYRAEMIADSCSGVADVQNNLRVTQHADSPSTYDAGTNRSRTTSSV